MNFKIRDNQKKQSIKNPSIICKKTAQDKLNYMNINLNKN